MCARLKVLFIFFLWLCLFAGVIQPQETESWYLISETELSSIEELLEKSEKDRQSWELQARGLKKEAENLNGQLATGRRQFRALEESFNEYESDALNRIASKNGEIADLKQEKAEKELAAEKWKGKATKWIIIAIALIVSWFLFIAFKVCRFFRLIP